MNRLLTGLLISAFTVVMVLTAIAELNRHSHETTGRVVNGKVSVKPLAVPDGMQLKAVKGSFKYKSETEADAQQMWVIAGEVPTSHTSFDTVQNFTMIGQEPDTPFALNHPFLKDPEGVKGRNGDRLKQKFVYYNANSTRSSGHHSFPSYGFFKAAIKDGKMQFMYSIKKANEGNMLIGMEDYGALHDGMKDQKPYKESGVPFECALAVDAETHGTDGSIAFKATKSKGKGTIE